jgi:hypothetical protein
MGSDYGINPSTDPVCATASGIAIVKSMTDHEDD